MAPRRPLRTAQLGRALIVLAWLVLNNDAGISKPKIEGPGGSLLESVVRSPHKQMCLKCDLLSAPDYDIVMKDYEFSHGVWHPWHPMRQSNDSAQKVDVWTFPEPAVLKCLGCTEKGQIQLANRRLYAFC